MLLKVLNLGGFFIESTQERSIKQNIQANSIKALLKIRVRDEIIGVICICVSVATDITTVSLMSKLLFVK